MEEEVAESYIECYVRFNDDLEKDYCFQFKSTTKFNELFKIFNTLPISLRPSVFYSSKPKGFKISTSPGYLTEDGGLLFDYDATKEKYLKNVDLNDEIGESIWPGQLIVPVWEHNDFAFYGFVTFLICWLYTDLPDFISPTPGICLTNQISKLASYVLHYFGKHSLAESFVDDLNADIGIVPQIVFFVFHIIKVGVIYLFLYLGLFNPIKIVKFMGPPAPKEITKEQLLELGWTGSKRATIDEYKEFYRDYRIKSYKSMVEAHQDGLFERLKTVGIPLTDGEGYNTPLDSKYSIKDIIDKKKLVLSFPYLRKLEELFLEHLKTADVNEAGKQFRKFGLLKSDDEIKNIVAIRKEAL